MNLCVSWLKILYCKTQFQLCKSSYQTVNLMFLIYVTYYAVLFVACTEHSAKYGSYTVMNLKTKSGGFTVDSGELPVQFI